MELPPGAVLLDEDFGTSVVNATDVPTADVYQALENQDRSLVQALSGWVQSTRLAGFSENHPRRNGGIFMRDRYVAPAQFYEQMKLAYHALETDDIVAGVAESTESLAFSGMSFFAADRDEQDVYNQMAQRIDLDARMREIWRELFAVSQVYIAVWSSQQTFKMRGTTPQGIARKKTITCVAPQGMTLLDPLKIVPVGLPLFGKEQLAYIASREEESRFNEIVVAPFDPRFENRTRDEIVERFIVGRYTPDRIESAELATLGVNPSSLWLLNPENVFSHSLTKPGYSRVAPVRMRSVFELLDMKQQLRQMERAHLIGATNFIVLITKGSDQIPARPEEIANLQTMVKTVARVPILIGDHRLSVEIVTPKIDNTLRAERHNTLDSRLTARLYQMFMLGNYAAGAGGDDSVKLVKVIARGMESRRHMIMRSLEKHVFRPMFEGNEVLTTRPKLQFHPRSIALDFDAAYASFLFDLRQANDLSRETILSQFDLSQELEAKLREREQEEYDEIFKTQVPFSAPNPALPPGQQPPPGQVPPGQPPPGQPPPANQPPARRDNGGGRRGGGGAAPGSGQGQPPRRAGSGVGERRRAAAAQVRTVLAEAENLSKEQILAALRTIEGEPDDES
jgi:hypothetical protein